MNLYLMYIRDLALKIIYIIIGAVGVLDNLFVIIVFALFIKIIDKVLAIFVYQGRFNPRIVSVGGKKPPAKFLNRKQILIRVGPDRFMTSWLWSAYKMQQSRRQSVQPKFLSKMYDFLH